MLSDFGGQLANLPNLQAGELLQEWFYYETSQVHGFSCAALNHMLAPLIAIQSSKFN